ncbi:H-NS histone family protein [Bradyrhizobium sp. Tv2a-2]|uniref:H-NS histone family protein n=1 Tax=Bradyrhizobium sp. Tv2a-2 TaxID=113395 RepID=UPI00041F5814|nr:H-NS histone family protein [Bradyrhizobium sp. Tv2a-2]
MIKKSDLEAMTVDQLWQLHEELGGLLSARLISEKQELEKRLAQLRREENDEELGEPGEAESAERRPRRAYPRVLPKYQNPENPTETWSGRGKKPRWVSAALNSGHQIDEFLIASAPIAANAGK